MTAAGMHAGQDGSLRVALVLLLAGCGHDWSAADAADSADADATGDDVAVEDVPQVDGPDAMEDAPPPDADDARVPDGEDGGAGDVPPDLGVCTRDEPRCLEDRMTLATCDPETGAWVFEECPVACLEDGSGLARCAELVPSNVPPGETWDRGWTPVECGEGDIVVFETTEGGVFRLTGAGGEEVLREPGEGTLRGIPFRVYWSSEGDMPLAAWSLGALHVRGECMVAFHGAYPAALFVETDVLVEGRVTAAAAVLDNDPGEEGPGGGPGGAAGMAGGGPGGGRPGMSGASYNDGGGGGGGFGGPGGAGGTARTAAGGIGGATYGTPELVPLVGGSGGGGGAGPHGGTGGGGGGAIQISAQGTIRIGVRGSIDAGGGGGQGGLRAPGNTGAGGGGGSGGAILLEAAVLEVEGVVAANGGGGGAGGSQETDVDGRSGVSGQPALTAAPGGLAQPGATDGGDGSDAMNRDGRNGENAALDSEENAGGGGGGAGRIRINVVRPGAAPEAHLSPAPGTGLATFGSPALR